MTPDPLLRVENLETTFFTKAGALKAVDGVSYQVNQGETVGIVGESGCGKSVTSFSVLRLLSYPGRVTGGRVLFKGTDLLQAPPEGMRAIRGKQIAMIFQEPMTALNPVLTVGFQITEQIETHEAVTRKEARNRAVALLELVGIPSPARRLDDYPHQLSGGMRQRAMIAMALSCNPDLLIADEPTTALDVTIQAQILDLLQRLQEERRMAMQFITHDLGVISELADRVIVMYAGRVVEEAPAAALFAGPRHPYTVGLLDSIPRVGGRTQERLATIPGVVPSLLALPPGCRFQNRCPHVTEVCRRSEPPLVDDGAGRRVACFNPY
jgi:oligopeptide/dipeptide ABC transporter ATP-binding protein